MIYVYTRVHKIQRRKRSRIIVNQNPNQNANQNPNQVPDDDDQGQNPPPNNPFNPIPLQNPFLPNAPIAPGVSQRPD